MSIAAVFRKLQKFKTIAFSEKYLLPTNLAISASLSTVGDIIEQKYEIYCEEIDELNPKRTGRMAISGVTVGAICHYWYKFLDRRIPGRGIDSVIKKILLDQLICSPVYISIFFITVGVLERKSRLEMWEDIKDKAWRLYVAEWVVWPTAQFVNFYFLPNRYRVLYDNVISLGYDVFTSQVKYRN